MEQARSSGNEGQSSFILNKKPIPEVTLIVHEQSLDKSVLVRIVQECHTPYFYHKFIIGNIGNYSKKYILKTISNFVYPASFRALHFTISKNKAVFLSRNCQELLLKICSEKFRIANPECPETPFKVIILANFILYEEVEVEDNSQSIIDAITKRFNSETETMDLNEFSEDEDLIDYYPLFQIKILLAVTSKVAEFLPKHLNLQKNCIRDISNLHPLKDFIESIDLCNNMIEDISALMPLINFKTLKHLSLSGNPFCEKYYNYNYVLDVKRYCQSLEKLDGFDITTPVFQKNLFCSDDAMDLAKNFLEHYFTIYDSGNRQNLIDIYAKDALFSVTAKIVPNQRNSSSTKLEHYGLRIPFTIYGATEIVKLFKTFPKTYHDPYPSVCDVTLLTMRVEIGSRLLDYKASFQDTHASLVVGGIFKELQQLLSFTRHFIFKRSGNTFHIMNEQLHVSNALDFQTGWSFGFPMHLAYSGNPLPYFQEQYRQLEETVHEITTMNYEYSQKYLDYCQYDLKKTLDLFSTLHVRGDVPENAFTPESAASKQLQKSVPPYPERIRKMAYKKHKSINLKTIWEILQSERTRDASDSPPTTDPTIQKIYRNVIIPTIGDGFGAPTKSLLPLQAPVEDKNISQKAPIKPISFNIPAVANPAKIKPTQMVKPATKANVDPLVELAEKMAKYKEIAAKKAAELSKIPLPSSGPSRVNQTAASVPSMVPPPPSIVPATAQLSQIPGAAIHSNLLNPVPAPLFTPATTMEQHLVPSHRLPPPLMPAQYQMHSNFSMQYQVPMQHQLPVPYIPNTHVLVPQDSVQGRPNLQSVPRAVFPISGNVQPNYQNGFQTPNPTMVPNVPRPSGLPMVPNLGGMVPQPGFPVPRFPVVQSPVVPQLNQPRVSVPTAFSMVPSPVVSRPRVTVPRPTMLLDQTLVTKPVSSSQVASNVQPSGMLHNKESHRDLSKKNENLSADPNSKESTEENKRNLIPESNFKAGFQLPSEVQHRFEQKYDEAPSKDSVNNAIPMKRRGRLTRSGRRAMRKFRMKQIAENQQCSRTVLNMTDLTAVKVNEKVWTKLDCVLKSAPDTKDKTIDINCVVKPRDNSNEGIQLALEVQNRSEKNVSAADTKNEEYPKQQQPHPKIAKTIDIHSVVKPRDNSNEGIQLALEVQNRSEKNGSAADTKNEEYPKQQPPHPNIAKTIDIHSVVKPRDDSNEGIQLPTEVQNPSEKNVLAADVVDDTVPKKRGRRNPGKRQRHLIRAFKRKCMAEKQQSLASELDTSDSNSAIETSEKVEIKLNRISTKSASDTKDESPKRQGPDKEGSELQPFPEIVKKIDIKLNRIIKPTDDSNEGNEPSEKGIPGHIEIGEKYKTDKESGRYLTGKLESRWEEGRRFSRSKSRSRSRSRNRRSRSRDRYRRSRSHSRNRRSRSRSKDRSKRSNSLSRDRTKRSNSRNRIRRSRSRSKDRSKRSYSRSRDRSKRSNSRSRNRRSRSRSKDRSKRGNSCSRDRSKRSNSRNRNRRSRSRSKKRSNSRSRDTSKRSSSLSRNRRSRSRSKDRSKRGNSCSKDRPKRSNSHGRNVPKRSRSRSRDRSKRSRSRSIDKSRRSRSRSRNAKSRRNDSKAATIISPAEPENANEVSGVKSKVTTVGSTPRNRSQDAKRKSPGSEKRNESTVSSKIVVTSNISSPRVTIASKIAKIKEVLGKISDIQETRQEQAANEAASKKNTGKVIVDNKNKKGGAKMTKDSNQGFKSKWDKGPQPETTGSGSLIIERSASGAVVKISTAKNAPGSGPPVSFNSGTPDTVDTGDDETAMLALALLERKRQLDFEIQRGFEKIKELEKLRSSTNPKDTSKDDIANEVCSTKEDASVQEKVTAEEDTPIKSVNENSDEIAVKDIERPEESPANKGEVDIVPPSDDSNKIEECVSAKSEGTSDIGGKLDQGKSSVDNSNRSNDESNEKENGIAPKTAIGETNVNIEKIVVTVKESTKHIIEADVIKPPNQDELKPTEILLVETELKLEKEIKSPNESVAKIKPMEKESVKHEDSLMKPTNQNESKPLDVPMTKTHLGDNSDAETSSSILTPKSEGVPKVEGKIMLGKPHSDESNAKSGDISSKRIVEETNIVTEKKSMEKSEGVPKVEGKIMLEKPHSDESTGKSGDISSKRVVEETNIVTEKKFMEQLDKQKLSEMSIIKEELKLENVSVKSTCENLLQSTDNVTLKSETILTEKESIEHEQKVMRATNQNESLKVPIIKTDLADNSNAETSSTFLKPKSDGIPKVDEKSMIKIPSSDDSTEKESTELEISIPSTNKRVKLEKLQKTEEVKQEENWVKPTNQPETMTLSADNPNTETSNIMVEIPKSEDELPEREKNASTETTVEETNANRKIDGSRNEFIKQDVDVTVTPTDTEKSQSNNIVEIPELNEISKDTEVDTKIMAENIPVGNKPPNTKELISSTDKDEHGKTDSKEVTISIGNKPTEEETTTKTKIQESDQQKIPVEAPGIEEIDSKNALSVSEKGTDSSETISDEVPIEEHNVVTSSIGQSSIEVVQTSEIREVQGQKTDDPIKVTTKSTEKEETSIEDTPSESHDGVDNTDESSKTVNTSKSHGPVAIIMDKTENLETPSRENIATVTDTDEFTKENISLESIKSADVDKPDMEDDLFRCPKQAIEANITPKPTDTDEIIRETTSEVQPCDNNEDYVTENILAQASNEEDKKTEDMKEEKSLDKEATKDQLGEVVTSRSSRKKSADESTYAFRCPKQAIEANITPKPTDTDEIIRETTSEVQPCDNNEDNVTENILAQASNEEDKKTEDMKEEKSLDKEATKDQLDEVVTSRSSRKKSADESTYAIEKIVQLAGISNPEPILAAAMDIPITNDVEIDDTTKVIEKITETSTNTVNEQLMDNLNSSIKINKKIVDETTNESKKMPDERQHVDSTELKTTTSDTSAEDMEQDSESKKLAADYSKKLIVLLKNVASDPRTAEKRIPHETLGRKEAQVHQPKEPKQFRRQLGEISIAEKLNTDKYLTVNLVRMSLGVNSNLKRFEGENRSENKKLKRKRLNKNRRHPPTSIQKSLKENNDSDNEKAFMNKDEPAQFQESSDEPIFIPKKIPLVLVDSSDEESNKTDEEVEEEETLPITEGLTVIDEIQSNDNDENVTTTREVVKTIRIDSPILLTISSDEEDNTSQDKIIFIDEDSDQEIEYVGLKDIL